MHFLINLSLRVATTSARSLTLNIFKHSAVISELFTLKIFLPHDTIITMATSSLLHTDFIRKCNRLVFRSWLIPNWTFDNAILFHIFHFIKRVQCTQRWVPKIPKVRALLYFNIFLLGYITNRYSEVIHIVKPVSARSYRASVFRTVLFLSSE